MSDTKDAQPSPQRLEGLMDRAIDTLETILADPAVPARERADLALRLLSLGMAGQGGVAAVPSAATLLPVQFVSIPDFLPPDLYAAAIETARSQRERFAASTVTTNEPGYRNSRVLYDDAFPSLRDAMRQEITAVLPAVFSGLARPAFDPARFEIQMTTHGEGDFFKMHSDAASPDTAGREITFVYYFLLRRSCAFSGGTLRLYPTWNTVPQQPERAQFHDVTPADNMIVFFDSHLLHEVLPLHVPSGNFEEGRFTLNGWLHR